MISTLIPKRWGGASHRKGKKERCQGVWQSVLGKGNNICEVGLIWYPGHLTKRYHREMVGQFYIISHFLPPCEINRRWCGGKNRRGIDEVMCLSPVEGLSAVHFVLTSKWEVSKRTTHNNLWFGKERLTSQFLLGQACWSLEQGGRVDKERAVTLTIWFSKDVNFL